MKLRAVLFFILLLAAPASAAPTCQDRGGDTVRCGTPAAMPVGWTAPEADRHVAPADKSEIAKAAAILLLLFALIALLPDFDGARWDEERFDEDERNDPGDHFER